MTYRAIVFVAPLAAAFAVLAFACSSSSNDATAAATVDSGAGPDGVSTEYGCNVEDAAVMSRYDPARGCFVTATPMAGICVGDAHSRGAGLAGSACAFAPDGTLYVENVCENCVLSGSGYHYVQYTYGGLTPQTPAGEEATAAEQAQCEALWCQPDCTTGKPFGDPYGNSCPVPDAGADDAASDAALDH